MKPTYRVVFRGELLEGFEISSVKQSAEARLKAPPAMLEQLFSGRRVILKKGIPQDIATRYIVELENLGMKASMEAETPPAQADEPAPPPPPIIPAYDAAPSPILPRVTTTPETALPSLEALSQDLGAYAPPTEAAVFTSHSTPSEGTVFAPQYPSRSTSSVPAAEQTVFVPRHAAAEPTMLVDPATARQHSAAFPPAEPTVFVPRSTQAEPTLLAPLSQTSTNRPPPADATVFVPRPGGSNIKRGFDSERTLIASAETLAEYFSATTPSQAQDDPSLLDDSGATAALAEPTNDRIIRGSNDKTVLADAPPAYRPGSNDTTVFVAPRRGSSDQTIMTPLGSTPDDVRRSLADELDRQDEEQFNSRNNGKSGKIVVILVLLAAAAASYYYFMM